MREEPLGDRSEKIAVRAELAKVASEKTVGEYLDRHRRRKYDRRRNRPHPRPNQGATRNLRRGQGGNRTGRPVCTVLRIGLLARRADVQGDRRSLLSFKHARRRPSRPGRPSIRKARRAIRENRGRVRPDQNRNPSHATVRLHRRRSVAGT